MTSNSGSFTAENTVKFGFWPGSTDPATYQPDWSALTHVAYSSWAVHSDGEMDESIVDINRYYAVRDKAHQNGVKVIICVSSDTPSSMDQILAYHREDFANNVLSTLQKYSADGVNIDWEEPNVTNGITGESNVVLFEQLMQNLNITLKTANSDYHISTDTYTSVMDVHRNANLSQYIDSIFLMEYDMYLSAGTSGPNSPMYDPHRLDIADSIAILYSYEYPKDKIILGIPFYGYDYTTVSNQPRSEASGYSDIEIKTAIQNASIYGKQWDSQSSTPWYAYKNGSQWHQVWYDDEKSLQIKYDYAKSENISGVGFWALGYEGNNTEIWKIFKN